MADQRRTWQRLMGPVWRRIRLLVSRGVLKLVDDSLQLQGVTRAWEDPLGMGPGSVVLRIMADDASDGPLPSQQLLDAVLAYIEERKNVQAQVYVVAPDTQAFAPELIVTPDTEEVRSAAAQALADLVEREGEPGGTLLISRIRAAISLAPGVEDYDLQSPTADVTHATGVLPLLQPRYIRLASEPVS